MKIDIRAVRALMRVTIGRITLEIQIAEGVAGDLSDRILVIPWTPPSPYRRRSAGRAGSGSAASRQGPSSRTFPDC